MEEIIEAITEAAEETTERITNALNTGGAADNMVKNGGGGSSFWIFIYYAVVLALFFAGMFFLRKYLLRKRPGAVRSGTYMKVLDRLAISQDKMIILIETGNKILIVGVAPQKMDTLAEFTKEEFGEMKDGANENPSGDNNGGAKPSFLSLLGGRFNVKDGGKNEK